MERSLNKTSRSSLGVNLPIEWTKKFGLKPKDKLKLIEKGNRIVLSTNLTPEKEITIDLTEGNITSIRQSIRTLYMEGYDIIHLIYQPTTRDFWSEGVKILSTKEFVQKTVEDLMLLECMELSDVGATLQTMESEYNIREFKRILRLTFIILKNFAQEINKGIQKKKYNQNFSFLESQHKNLRRYIRYSNRYLAKVGMGEKTLSYKDLFATLERLTICLKFMYTMHKELPIKMEFGSEALNLFKDITDLLTASLDNFNNYSPKTAACLYEKRRELTLKAYQLAKSNYKADIAISQRWVEILSKIVFIINHSAPISYEKPKICEVKMDATKTGIILAGGNGTRMLPVTQGKIPKPLVKLRGRPLLCHTLDFFIDNGVKNIVVATSYLHEHMKDTLALYVNKADIIMVVEESPLGTAGAIKNAVKCMGINENFYVTYADTLTSINLLEMGDVQKNDCPNGVLMALAPTVNYESDRVVRLNSSYRICGTVRYPIKEDLVWSAQINNHPLVDAGIYVLNTCSLRFIDEGEFSTDTFFERLVDEEMLYGFPTTALYFNIGTPEILNDAEQRWKKERRDQRIPLRRIRQ